MKHSMGWRPSLPDIRDYTVTHHEIAPMMKGLKIDDLSSITLPSSIDLSAWCSPIEDQETIGSCTAQAGIGLFEYYERRAFGKFFNGSRLFLYKTTRNLDHFEGDTGAYLRSTMGAMVLFGVPPEEYWPYEINRFDEEPPSFCYSFAQNFRTLKYMRLDLPGTSNQDLLDRIKTNLAAGLPSMFGFTVYSSINQAQKNGEIPFPIIGDKVEGGHAVVAIGFDDNHKIQHMGSQSQETVGAFKIRNSWGVSWGDQGYGWLPYAYVLNGLAVDWWSLLKSEWIDTGEFNP